jgi:beta-1,4-N-acetylglucosaminyltransferase
MTTFVSIGNGTQGFSRLLDEVVRISDQLPQPIIIQRGRTPFSCGVIEHFDFTDEAGFLYHLRECKLFITHGGGGSVFSAIKLGKKAVVVPRRKHFDEIVDDHQMAFAAELATQGKIVPVYDIADLQTAAKEAVLNPTIPARADNADTAIREVSKAVLRIASDQQDKICIVTPSGGHLTEARELAPAYRDRPHFFVINTPIVQPLEMQGRTIEITISQRDLKFFVNIWEAFQILRRERPKVILTTGGGFSVAFALVGKLLDIPTIYVETVAKVNVPTATGKVMYWIADRFFYQWPYLERHFPKGEYIGLVL